MHKRCATVGANYFEEGILYLHNVVNVLCVAVPTYVRPEILMHLPVLQTIIRHICCRLCLEDAIMASECLV